ncbi:MAG: 2,3-diaminopropionate biosynthesis protein SbnA [Acidobacteriota bacterium]
MVEMEAILRLKPSALSSRINWIGNTSLKSIYLNIDGIARKVHLKLEGENPAGSVKDRTAIALIQHVEAQKLIKQGSVIIESTSGNLGVALALICRARGYQFLSVVDPKASRENVMRMRALGADIEQVHEADAKGGYLLARLARVQELCRKSDGYIWTNQYSNAANPQVHYSSTAPELHRQMNGRVDAVFVAVSTGGTLAGIGRFFREKSPATRVIGVDAKGSVVFGGLPGPRRLTGIGSAQQSNFITSDSYDEHMLIGDEEAFAFCRALLDMTGISVGGSAGAVLAACVKYLRNHPTVHRVACLCADRGENYSSTIFNDEWIKQQGLRVSFEQLEGLRDISLQAPNLSKALGI